MIDYFRKPEDTPTDLSELDLLLTEHGIPHILKRHPAAESRVKDLIGYYPTGEWQIIIDKKYSVIRGMASFGAYEIFGIADSPLWRDDPERFVTPEQLVAELENYKESK